MVDRQQDTLLERIGHQRAIDRNSQCLLSDPALAQLLDCLNVRLALLAQQHGARQGF